MVDVYDRWCLFCDFEVHAPGEGAPPPVLDDYIDPLIAMAQAGTAKRIFENESRVTRISSATRVTLPDGSPAVALLITLGDRRGADPGFIHFDEGLARDAEKLDGEVKGVSSHCVLSLAQDPQAVGRFRMLLEETRGIGRTPVTRLLGAVLSAIAEDRGERYVNPRTGRQNKYRPIVEVHPRRSREMAEALDEGSFLPVDLLDTSAIPAFDENPEYEVRRHVLSVKVRPGPGRTYRQAVSDLAATARDNGYDRMRVSWRLPGQQRGGTSEMSTDLADLGTALFAHRELVHIANGLTECAGDLSDEFVEAMLAEFV